VIWVYCSALILFVGYREDIWPLKSRATAKEIKVENRHLLNECKKKLQAIGFKKKDVLHCSVPSKPPWLLKRPQIDFSMHVSCKESTPPEIFRAKYYEICDQYKDYCKLYTDGSMSGDQVGNKNSSTS